jgi:hypothetical protein
MSRSTQCTQRTFVQGYELATATELSTPRMAVWQ